MSEIQPITVLDRKDLDDHLVASENERRNQIKIIIRKELSVSFHIIDSQGNEANTFTSPLLGINQEHDLLIFATTSSSEINNLASGSQKLLCAASIHDIPVEFELSPPKQAQLAGTMVFVTKMPNVVARIQRRQFFRVEIPPTVSATCYFLGKDKSIKTEIIDISIGGLSIRIAGELPLPFEMNDIYEQCEVQLSIGDNLKIDLEVRNIINKEPLRKKPITHIGLSFRGISESMQSQIQRFIFNIESQRLRTR